jgi:hypothetical protein
MPEVKEDEDLPETFPTGLSYGSSRRQHQLHFFYEFTRTDCPIFAVFPPSLQNYYISFSLIINRDIN